MASETASKLNRLYQRVPEGFVVDAAWLEKNGYSHPLRQKYVAGQWLKAVMRGVYQRPAAQRLGEVVPDDAPLAWQPVVLALQNLMEYGVSVGGRTALALHGFAHYLAAGGVQEVHLYASEALPGWLTKILVNARWVAHNPDRLFVSPGRGLDSVMHTVTTGNAPPHAVTREDSDMAMEWGHWRWPLTLSTPERAVLELLDELPNNESFDQVDALFGGLGTLMPRRLQRLLEACQSVKVKRLFFFFADRHNHRWLKQLDRKCIEFGKGKRALVPGGRLDATYQITVPEEFSARRVRQTSRADAKPNARYTGAMNRDHIINALRELRSRLEARGIAHAGVFGSVARNEVKATSDIDIVVTPHHGRKLDLFDLGGVQTLLNEHFDGIDIDVVVEPVTRPELLQAIRQDRVNAF